MDGEEIVVDSLVLDVTVRDKSQGETSEQKISALQKALAKFERTVVGLDVNAFKAKFSSMATAIKPLVNQLKKAEKGLSALAKVLSNSSLSKAVATVTKQNASQTTTQVVEETVAETKPEQVPIPQEMTSGSASDWFNRGKDNEKDKIQDTRTELERLTASYGDLIKTVKNADGTQTQYFENFKGKDRVISQVTSAIDDQGEIIKGTAKLAKQTFEDISGDSLKSFIASVRRIGLYRAIRTLLKFVTQSIEESVKNLSSFDAEARRTMTQLSSSITVIKNSIGLMIMPLLQLVTPILQVLATVIGTVANAISQLVASLKGQSTWTKINIDYLKEYNKQAKLLSFDEFNSLSKDQGISGLYSTEKTSEVSAGASAVYSILTAIAGVLTAIGISKIIKLITDGGLKKGIEAITDGVSGLFSSTKLLIAGIGLLAMGIISLITNWDKLSTTAKVLIPVLSTILGIIAGIAVGIAAAKAGVLAPWKAGITAAALAAGISMVAGTAIAVSKHANGGMFEGTGTIYHQAGEAGPEIVATGSRGTGVVNIDQFKVAMIEALSEYNAARNSGPTGDLIVQLDGKEIARSQVSNNAAALMQRYNIVLKPR